MEIYHRWPARERSGACSAICQKVIQPQFVDFTHLPSLPGDPLATGRRLIVYSDQLAQLNHCMASINSDNWMTDVLEFKTYIALSEPSGSSESTQTLMYYAAIV
jgi:hypothetical protein